MIAQQYLAEIIARLVASPIVSSISIVEEWSLSDQGYFRARMTLSNNDFLEVAEYFVVVAEQHTTKRYRYQWMDSSQQKLRKRWDNVEHFPNLSNYPHHVHIGEKTRVEPGRRLNIVELLEIIEAEITEYTDE